MKFAFLTDRLRPAGTATCTRATLELGDGEAVVVKPAAWAAPGLALHASTCIAGLSR
ncbi:MAG: hypothetical protein FJ102_23810 [Deltaproteobacteria bacterium]|nr:hypothetical protein [Deltaproteobacteria bacterium]